MRHGSCSAGLLSAWLLLSPHGGAAEVTQRVRVTGTAVAEAGQTAAGIEAARRAALRQAVEEGVGVLVTSTTAVRDYAVIDDRILSGTRGYVRAYDTVEESTDADGTCRVTIDAVVDLGGLHRDLAALELAAIGAGLPRVLCVADETGADGSLHWGVVAAELRGLVAAMTDLLEVATGDTSDAAAGADIVVRGTAAVLPTDPPIPMAGRSVAGAGLATAAATLRVEVRWVDEGAPVAVLQGRGRGAGTSPREAGERALRHAVSTVADSLRAALAEDLRRRAFSTRVVDVVVEGAGTDLDGLTRALTSGLGPVQSLVPRGLADGAARFQVRSSAGAFDLARQLSARGMGEASVEILQVTANSLRLALHEGGPSGDPR